MGATELALDADPGADGTIWAMSYVDGIQIEAGWRSIDRQRALVDEVVRGHILDHQSLTVADTVLRAVPLRSDGRLAEWQRQLAVYPDAAGDRLISTAVEGWSWPPFHRALAARGESLALTSTLLGDVHAVLRLLFALNRLWDPDWKWLHQQVGGLAVAPERLAERIDEIFAEVDMGRAVDVCFQLVLDTLRLLPADDGVGRAMAVVQGCLRRSGP